MGALLLIAIVVLRGRSFFTPFSDPTPGLYLHIGRAWLHGYLPYTTTWDYRPPGYFALYAVAMSLVGAAFARDALAVVSLAATAVAVGSIAVEIDVRKRSNIGYWAAAFFVLLSPVNDGIAGVAELQISACIAWAIYLAITRSSSASWTVLGGFLAAMAIQCKLSALPLAIVPMVLVGIRSPRVSRSLTAFFVGFIFPIAADIALYARSDGLAILWNANVESTIRRAQSAASGNEFARNRINFVHQLLALAPQLELAIFGIDAKVNASRVAGAGWFVAALLSIGAAGEFYERQFVLLTAPIALLGAIGFLEVTARVGSIGARRWVTIGIVFVTFALHDYFEVNQTIAYTVHRLVLRDARWRLDQAAELDSALACLPKGPNELYLLEQNPYVYDLLGDASPTKYAYSDHLLDPRLSLMAGIDGDAELTRIFATSPRYVVVSGLQDFRYGADRIELIRETLSARYLLVDRNPRFRVYRSRLAPMPAAHIPCTAG